MHKPARNSYPWRPRAVVLGLLACLLKMRIPGLRSGRCAQGSAFWEAPWSGGERQGPSHGCLAEPGVRLCRAAPPALLGAGGAAWARALPLLLAGAGLAGAQAKHLGLFSGEKGAGRSASRALLPEKAEPGLRGGGGPASLRPSSAGSGPALGVGERGQQRTQALR